MRVVVAMDSFKGTMSAATACARVKTGLQRIDPNIDVVLYPMADGGEGTVETLIDCLGGCFESCRVNGPVFGRKVDAVYACFPEQQFTLVEMAAASGLLLINDSDRNPLKTTTFGTGELIQAALKHEMDQLFLAVGGSATVDGGVGAAMALGWQFLNRNGDSLGYGGGALEQLDVIIRPEHTIDVSCKVLCDVDNPLCGPQGAARVYGPQKGADASMVEKLERGLDRLATVVERELGLDISSTPGGGAAGGLAAGAVAFLNAGLTSGIEAVIGAVGLESAIQSADWVITGEGRFDGQTTRGKVVAGIAAVAEKYNVPVAVLAGEAESADCLLPVHVVLAARPDNMSKAEALRRAEELLEKTAAEFTRLHLF